MQPWRMRIGRLILVRVEPEAELPRVLSRGRLDWGAQKMTRRRRQDSIACGGTRTCSRTSEERWGFQGEIANSSPSRATRRPALDENRRGIHMAFAHRRTRPTPEKQRRPPRARKDVSVLPSSRLPVEPSPHEATPPLRRRRGPRAKILPGSGPSAGGSPPCEERAIFGEGHRGPGGPGAGPCKVASASLLGALMGMGMGMG